MDQIEQLFQTLVQYRSTYPVQWDALTLFTAVFSIILSLAALRRSGRGGSARLGRIEPKVELIETKLDTERVRRERETAGLSDKITDLEARLEELEVAVETAHTQPAAEVVRPLRPAAEPEKRQLKEKIEAERYVPSALTFGLKKARSGFFGRLRGLFAGKPGELEQILPGLEELLLASDLGVKTTDQLITIVRERFAGAKDVDERDVVSVLKIEIERILTDQTDPQIVPRPRPDGPQVIVIVGVNGVGKTTTIGKLAAKFKDAGAKVMLGACDTFRAAAVEQLKSWGQRTESEVISGLEDAKPSTVAYQALAQARQDKADVLIIDTAGRLHTRSNLMNELEGVVRILDREYPGAPHETILVLDASTGQNALAQAREFHQRAKLTGVVVTKLDGTPKGGIIVAIKDELGVPIRYIGVGEGIDDLRPFSAREFADALFEGETEAPVEETQPVSARAAVRRRRREGEA